MIKTILVCKTLSLETIYCSHSQTVCREIVISFKVLCKFVKFALNIDFSVPRFARIFFKKYQALLLCRKPKK